MRKVRYRKRNNASSPSNAADAPATTNGVTQQPAESQQQHYHHQPQLQQQQQQHQPNSQFNNDANNQSSSFDNSGSNDVIQQPPKKPLSPAEMELTAKNYRLAKELADLRQRHRDETKTVTRLTMENMNLASKCRQAMVHIEKLQEELDNQKQKYADTILRQRKNENNTRSPFEIGATNKTPMNNTADVRKRLVKEKKGPQQPQDNDTSPMTISSPEDDDEYSKFALVLANNEKTTNKNYHEMFSNRVNSVERAYESKEEAIQQKVVKNNKVDNGDGANVDFGELHSDDFFTGTAYENSLPATPEKENVDILALKNQFEAFNMEDDEIKESNSGEDSIGAFEASFQTSFPTSFSKTPSDQNLSLDEIFNDGDSFFSSSGDMSGDKIPLPEGGGPIQGNNEHALFPDTFGDTMATISTPSKDKTGNDKSENLEPPSPPSEKQTGGAAARARYKYALTDPDENTAPMDEAEADRGETSPTLVLQRLQQRKAKEKLSSNSNSISSENQNNNKTSRSTISEEIRKLDAIASGNFSSQPTSRGSRRRSTKQPISYAEPTLKSKLRRGDVFFPKSDIVDNEANTEATAVKS